MKTFLCLALVAASSVLGVAVAVYLAGPPETQTISRPAKLVAQAVTSPPSVELPSVELQLPALSADRVPSRRTQALLDEPPLPQEEVAQSLPALKPVVVPVQARIARQATEARPAPEELPAPKPEPPVMLAQSPAQPTMGGLPAMSGGTAPSGDIMSNMVNSLMQNPEQMRQLIQGTGLQDQTLGNLLNQLSGQKSAPAPAAPTPAPAPQTNNAPADTLPPKTDDTAAEEHKATITAVPGSGSGGEHLMINIQNEDIRSVLEALSEQGELNILPSANVQGDVSAVLKDVDVNTALDAILRSTGFVAKREGKFIYVGTAADFDAMRMSLDTIGTRIFRPNYVTAKDLMTLLTPLVSAGVGKISITAPSEIGIQSDANKAGGNTFASNEAVLVQDYEGVLLELEQVVLEIDKQPMQVSIEAMILSVDLNDNYQFGINLEAFQAGQAARLGIGTPRTAPLNGTGQSDGSTGADLGAVTFTNGGLQFAYLNGNIGAFINAVETIGDTNVIATPKLLCLNKQRAEILIGAQYGYVNSTVTQTFTTQSVQFLEVGAALRIRPFIGTDGMIRMEIHPELSTGQVVVSGNFTLPQKQLTQVTTNVMCRDGCTVVLGGLMREDLETATTQVPVLGSIPYIGPFFRSVNETIVRREIMVLVTPRIIYEPDASRKAEKEGNAFVRRQQVVADHLSPYNRYDMSRRYTQKAEAALKAGDPKKAAHLLNLAMVFDPQNMTAQQLRSDLEKEVPPPAVRAGVALPATRSNMPAPGTAHPHVPPPPPGDGHAVDGEQVAPWLLDDLQGKGMTPIVPIKAPTLFPAVNVPLPAANIPPNDARSP